MILTLRILLLFTTALFWGGLTFYTGFVVAISHDVLNNPMDGGLITQQVTDLLQWLAAISVVPMAVNGIVIRSQLRRLGSALLVCTGVLSLTVIGLFVVHLQLDSVIDISEVEITDQIAFDNGHRRYNQLTTIEWSVTVVYLIITLFAWKAMDATTVHQQPEQPSRSTEPSAEAASTGT